MAIAEYPVDSCTLPSDIAVQRSCQLTVTRGIDLVLYNMTVTAVGGGGDTQSTNFSVFFPWRTPTLTLSDGEAFSVGEVAYFRVSALCMVQPLSLDQQFPIRLDTRDATSKQLIQSFSSTSFLPRLNCDQKSSEASEHSQHRLPNLIRSAHRFPNCQKICIAIQLRLLKKFHLLSLIVFPP